MAVVLFFSPEDWAGVEDPDWKANHQLSWGQLTDVREIGKASTFCSVVRGRHCCDRYRAIYRLVFGCFPLRGKLLNVRDAPFRAGF